MFEIVVWSLYALVWGLADENLLLNVDVEIILFAIVRFHIEEKLISVGCSGQGSIWSMVVVGA